MNLKDFHRGWFIGNFEPSLVRTEDFEIAVQEHKKGDIIDPHYQLTATEYNCVLFGSILVNNTILSKGDFFIFKPMEPCNIKIIEDVTILCVKMPSAGPADKVVI